MSQKFIGTLIFFLVFTFCVFQTIRKFQMICDRTQSHFLLGHSNKRVNVQNLLNRVLGNQHRFRFQKNQTFKVNPIKYKKKLRSLGKQLFNTVIRSQREVHIKLRVFVLQSTGLLSKFSNVEFTNVLLIFTFGQETEFEFTVKLKFLLFEGFSIFSKSLLEGTMMCKSLYLGLKPFTFKIVGGESCEVTLVLTNLLSFPVSVGQYYVYFVIDLNYFLFGM